jgi:hypothetical protein
MIVKFEPDDFSPIRLNILRRKFDAQSPIELPSPYLDPMKEYIKDIIISEGIPDAKKT